MSENQRQDLIDLLADGVVLVTEADRIVRYANAAACALLGRDHDALVGAEFAYPVAEGGEIAIPDSTFARVCEVRIADAEWQGQRAHLLCVRDISERHLELRLARARSRSERGQMASSIAQELGDPASSLTTNRAVFREFTADLEAMCADPLVPREVRERYSAAQTLLDMRAMLDDDTASLERIRACVRELGTRAREKVDKVENVSLAAIVERTCLLVGTNHEGDFQLTYSATQVPTIAADALKLMQLVMHLVENAIAGLKGSRHNDNTIELRTERRDQEICLTVRDPGRGMSREHMLRLFEPAYFSGTGHTMTIGARLAAVAEIASAHGGRVEVESELGEGSVFRVFLPVDTGLAPIQRERRVLPGQVRARVLWLSSDQERTREVHALLDADHDVMDSESKQHASQILDRDRDYDVILADVDANPKDAMALHKSLTNDAPELAQRMVLIAPLEMSSSVRRFIEKSHLLVLDTPLSNSTLREVVERMSF